MHCAPHPRVMIVNGFNMEVRSNFKAKVRCVHDNDEHKWPLSPSAKTQNLICNGCP